MSMTGTPTPNYNLPQYQSGDAADFYDLNPALQKVDEALTQFAESISTAVTNANEALTLAQQALTTAEGAETLATTANNNAIEAAKAAQAAMAQAESAVAVAADADAKAEQALEAVNAIDIPNLNYLGLPIDIYVSPLGNDSNSGLDEANPKATFQNALLTAATRGATSVNIRTLPGVFSADNLSIQGYGLHANFLTTTGVAIVVTSTATSYGMLLQNFSEVTFRDFTFRNNTPSATQTIIANTTDSWFTNCTFETTTAANYKINSGVHSNRGTITVGACVFNNLGVGVEVFAGFGAVNANTGTGNAIAYRTYAGMLVTLGTKPDADVALQAVPTGSIIGT